MASLTDADTLQSITGYITFYVTIFIFISGLIGNGLNILLFTTIRTLRRQPCGLCFLVESIVNLSQILFAIFVYIVEKTLKADFSINSTVWCKIKTTTIQSLHLIFISTVCSAAFDQLLSTHYLYSIRQMSTRKLTIKLILFSIILMVFHLILSLIFFENRSQLLGCVIYNPIVANYFLFFYYPILICLLPIMFTLLCSLFAFYNIRHLVRRQIPLERRESSRQLTAMTFARVLSYIVLGLPYIIFRIYSVQKPIEIDNLYQFAILMLIGSITGSIAYGNNVVRDILISIRKVL